MAMNAFQHSSAQKREKVDVTSRDSVGRGDRIAAVSDDIGGEQTIAANLRQADDLLLALDIVAERYPGDPPHFDSARRTTLSRFARRWLSLGHSPRICGPGTT